MTPAVRRRPPGPGRVLELAGTHPARLFRRRALSIDSAACTLFLFYLPRFRETWSGRVGGGPAPPGVFPAAGPSRKDHPDDGPARSTTAPPGPAPSQACSSLSCRSSPRSLQGRVAAGPSGPAEDSPFRGAGACRARRRSRRLAPSTEY